MTASSLRPDVAAYLEQVNAASPRLHEMPLKTARRVVRQLAAKADLPTGPIAIDRRIPIPTHEGASIEARLFDNRESRAPGPVVVYFHGGGWVLGDTDIYAPACAEIARQLDLPVLSIDYRRAPEYPLPVGQMDCEAAARWVAGNPDTLPVKATSLVLAGDSCGGAYAISTAMSLRDTPAALPVTAHLAFYPSADLATRYASFKEFATGHALDKHLMRWFAEHSRPDDSDYRASPMAGALVGLSPAVVITASHDPLRDQGRAYAEALAAAGVPVEHIESHGMIHAFLTMRRAIPSANADVKAALESLAATLRMHGTEA